ncbi:MAG: NAD-dependent DNA ligase LigA [Puniceicoccales bacterium]|jgi:DNA ligase (NAD+)|nr:NAD-dependent DNA ligase LigA [Puniceicoccales bacterium]
MAIRKETLNIEKKAGEPKLKRYFQSLAKKIEEHDRHYYREAAPIISDFEYDCLKHEWRELRQKYPSLRPESEGVGDDRHEGFARFPHLSPMLSLENTYDRSEVDAFDRRIRHSLGEEEKVEYILEHKIDGVAVNLIYEQGQLIRVLTRGNGFEGDDVTENVRTIPDLPDFLEDAPERLELRGEVYVPLKVFERLNRRQEERGEAVFANPRNLAAGSLKTKDVGVVRERGLRLWIHSLGLCEGQEIPSLLDFFQELQMWHLPWVEFFERACFPEEIWRGIEALDRRRSGLDFATDGVVLKLHERRLQRILGETRHAPRWAFAYKFAPERIETRLERIALQVGRSGVVTPIAEFLPVWIAGTEVCRATLHNAAEIGRRDIREGDTVLLEKAGEVIPAIAEVVLAKRPKDSSPFVFPKNCPRCGSPLRQAAGEVAWRCPDEDCPAKVEARILHFVSRSAMHIEGLGERLISQLCRRGFLRNVADLYDLSAERLMACEKIGQKSAEKILNHLERSKEQPLWRLLHGLGIPGIGEKGARDLEKAFSCLNALLAASAETLAALPGLGEKTATDCLAHLRLPSTQQIIRRLATAGVRHIGE